MSLLTVTHRVQIQAKAVDRNPQEIQIIAVSKDRSSEQIEPLLRQGHRLFGENRVQEAREKWPWLRQLYPKIELHLIGPLQTNKVNQALSLFDVIHTLDRPRLAQTLGQQIKKNLPLTALSDPSQHRTRISKVRSRPSRISRLLDLLSGRLRT